MEEFFFFLSGNGVYMVDGENVTLEKGVFVKIPANTEHAMKCTGTDTLEFFYFGIAI
jgi:mannose-6-phosphate isomerase-like protein (cupin superfamily)